MPNIVSEPKVIVSGRFLRIAKIDSEYYVDLEDPDSVITTLKDEQKADIFSFIQPGEGQSRNHGFYREFDSISVVPVSTYEHWWTRQINDKTRNMIRKANKMGVELRKVEFNDEFVTRIKEIYDEVKIKQGKANRHYGKSLDTLKAEHSSFLNCSELTGAFYQGKMIGFSKITFTKGRAVLMNIMSFNCHRDKAPSNALVAKAVEVCAERRIQCLQYGIWSKRGLGNFKKHHAFERLDVPRYFVPLTLKGRVALACKLHRSFKQYVPEGLIDLGIELRSRWQSIKFQKQSSLATGL